MSTVAFQYRAVDQRGRSRSGVATAASRAEAVRQLSSQGLTPLSLTESRTGSLLGSGRVPAKVLAHFTAQLSVLLAARVSISEVLVCLAEQETDPRLKGIITNLAQRIEAGETLSEALRAHAGVFGTTYIETVRSAESSGNLIKVLDLLSDMMERQEETRRQVQSALTYPAIVMGMLLLGCTFLVGYVVPKFARMFAQRGVELPWLTRVLGAVGDSIQSYWWLYALVIGSLIFATRRAWRTPAGRAWIEGALHRVPIIGRILPGLAISRFAHILGMGVSSGVPLLESIDMAGRSSGRAAMKRDADVLIERVRGGDRLADALKKCRYLSQFSRRMLSAGEASGELSEMCRVVARHYDRETSHLTKVLSQAIEPLLIVGLAGLVLVVGLAIFLPMWNMVNLVG